MHRVELLTEPPDWGRWRPGWDPETPVLPPHPTPPPPPFRLTRSSPSVWILPAVGETALHPSALHALLQEVLTD